MSSAQRRPGREPRRHMDEVRTLMDDDRRSTKAGARTPATPDRIGGQQHHRYPLNEGRGANPGDTARAGRPARQGPVRSTKAGARTPATRDAALAVETLQQDAQRRPGREPRRHISGGVKPAATPTAQRRPGREPRRHQNHLDILPLAPPRSTKAGARTPATPASSGGCGRTQTRSTKAGARTPATPSAGRRWRRCRARPLNEGRGANPGDTRGPPPAATPRAPLNEGRGANPGDTRGPPPAATR